MNANSNPNENPLLTPDEFRALVARLRRGTKLVRASHRMLMRTSYVTIAIGTFWRWWGLGHVFGSLVFVFMLVIELAVFLAWNRIRRNQVRTGILIRFVENTQEVKLLGPILDLYDIGDRLGKGWDTISIAVDNATIRLLPILQLKDANALNTHQRARIQMYLGSHILYPSRGNWYRPDHCLVVLSALEQIGDKHDLAKIETLLNVDYIQHDMRTAVERCAQAIRERVAREEDKDVLLRADRKPEYVEALLRPSIETAGTPPQQLLRAAASDEGNMPA